MVLGLKKKKKKRKRCEKIQRLIKGAARKNDGAGGQAGRDGDWLAGSWKCSTFPSSFFTSRNRNSAFLLPFPFPLHIYQSIYFLLLPPRPSQNFPRHVHDHDHDSSSPTFVTFYPSPRLDYRPDCSARRVPSCTLNLILSSNFQTWVLCHSISFDCSISSSTTSNLFLLLPFAKQPDRRILCPRLMIARFLGRH